MKCCISGMPSDEDAVYAKDLMRVLKKKHAAKGFKSMVRVQSKLIIIFGKL